MSEKKTKIGNPGGTRYDPDGIKDLKYVGEFMKNFRGNYTSEEPYQIYETVVNNQNSANENIIPVSMRDYVEYKNLATREQRRVNIKIITLRKSAEDAGLDTSEMSDEEFVEYMGYEMGDL